MIEVWKDIPNYEGLYQVSNLGRIRNCPNKPGAWNKEAIIIKTMLNTYGYPMFSLCKNGKRKTGLVHRCVAEAFIPNPQNLPQINHKDEDKTNNRVDNLEWCDCQYNNTYGTRIDRAIKKTNKAVCQYDLDGNFIKKWDSLSQINKELGFLQGNISSCCHGRYKTMYNYIWKYVDTGV